MPTKQERSNHASSQVLLESFSTYFLMRLFVVMPAIWDW